MSIWQQLEELDEMLLLRINGFHSSWVDTLMLLVTHRFTWLPLYVFIAVYLSVSFKKKGITLVFVAIVSVLVSEILSSWIAKPMAARLRPCHVQSIYSQLHWVFDNCGGQYGFYSSHASNSFTLAVFLILLLRSKNKWWYGLLFWAFLVSYSRLYLGVHYPSDVLAGALAGTGIAFLGYSVCKKCF